MQINSSIIYSIWPPSFLIICFSLPWKALHEAHRTSWGIKAHPRYKLRKPCSRGWTTPKSPKDSGPDSLRASLPCRWTPGYRPESTIESFLSYMRAPSLAGRSKLLPRSALGLKATVHLSKCPRCTAGCLILLLRERKRGETFPYKMQKRRELTPTHERMKVERCRHLLNLMEDGILPNLVFSDEKKIYVEQCVKHENDRV